MDTVSALNVKRLGSGLVSSRTLDTAAALELRVRGLFNNGTNDLVSPFFGSDLFLTTISRTW